MLPKYFKTAFFHSFIRQLNLYNFHKVKTDENHLEFINKHFIKDNKDSLLQIKRNSKKMYEGNELQLRNEGSDKAKKMSLSTLKNEIQDQFEKIMIIQKKIETLESKYDFYEYCHNELEERNNKIKKILSQELERESNLENIFFYSFKNFFPNINLLPKTEQDKLSTLSKKEIISQIYKNIQSFYASNSKKINFDSFFAKNANNLSTLLIGEGLHNQQEINANDVKEQIQFFNKIRNFQDKYVNQDDTYSSKDSQSFSSIHKKRNRDLDFCHFKSSENDFE